MNLRCSIAAALLLASPALGQITVNVTVGPSPAPPGCDVSFTLSHDGPGFVSAMGCPIRIFDQEMNLVADPNCGSPASVAIGPWGWITYTWDQRDLAGQQVPAGRYIVEFSYDFQAPTFHSFAVGPVEANLVLEGTPATKDPIGGGDRNFYLCAPQDGGEIYWLLASLTDDVGIATCGGTFPLDQDPLLQASLQPNSLFLGSLGFLGADGTSRNPRIPLPDDPSLIGIEFATAFMVLDFDEPCFVRRVSESYTMTVVE